MQAGTSFFNEDTPSVVIRSLFDKYDKDGSGRLNQTEINDLLQKDLGFSKEQAKVYSMLLDKDGDQTISFEEFLDWLHSGERFKVIQDKARFHKLCKAVELFKTHDADNSNNLSKDEFKHGAILYNEAEVFSLSITNPNGRPMLPFDWFIHSSLILASC